MAIKYIVFNSQSEESYLHDSEKEATNAIDDMLNEGAEIDSIEVYKVDEKDALKPKVVLKTSAEL